MRFHVGNLDLQWIVPVATSNIQHSGEPAFISTSSYIIISIIVHIQYSSHMFTYKPPSFHRTTTITSCCEYVAHWLRFNQVTPLRHAALWIAASTICFLVSGNGIPWGILSELDTENFNSVNLSLHIGDLLALAVCQFASCSPEQVNQNDQWFEGYPSALIPSQGICWNRM